ncbi:unnamed protein product, partial [Eruca vesicaria subsp. sativa]|nr:unnamed protein product [Eruca vesicaria subsp. sativa]
MMLPCFVCLLQCVLEKTVCLVSKLVNYIFVSIYGFGCKNEILVLGLTFCPNACLNRNAQVRPKYFLTTEKNEWNVVILAAVLLPNQFFSHVRIFSLCYLSFLAGTWAYIYSGSCNNIM